MSVARGLRSDAALEAEGWVRRHLAEPSRAEEAAAIYAEAGFEVRIEHLEPRSFAAGCRSCAASVCSAYVVIYTRKIPERTP